MLFKKKTSNPVLFSTNEYTNAISFAKAALETVSAITDKLDILEYFISTVKVDLQTDLLSAIIYSGDNLKEFNFPFPTYYHDENGIEQCAYQADETERKLVDLANDCVLALPWKDQSYISKLLHLKKDVFCFDKCSHECYYYEYVDLCYVLNGIHSISGGITYKKGSILAKVFHTKLLFPNIYTNGAQWFNVHTNQSTGEVQDFRIAIIYELCRIKYNIETE